MADRVLEEEVECSEAPSADLPEQEEEESQDEGEVTRDPYLTTDLLLTQLSRQGKLIAESLQGQSAIPLSVRELSLCYERNLFAPKTTPKQQENGTAEANPRLNFYPCFTVPEVLATYHIFFNNCRVPLSCKANRARADAVLQLASGAHIPDYETVESVSKVFEGLGDEEISDSNLEDKHSALVELKADCPRTAVLKRSVSVTHFAYPAVSLPPKVMKTIIHTLITRENPGHTPEEACDPLSGTPSISDRQIKRWCKLTGAEQIEAKRKSMTAVALITLQLEAMRRLFTAPAVIRKIGESLHYAFCRGYVKLASQAANVQLSNLVSYMGVLHENRLGQSSLHTTLQGKARRDYVRDHVFLFLVYTWQTAMGAWQQCMQDKNTKELAALLAKSAKSLWSETEERLAAVGLCDIVFPPMVFKAIAEGLPDLVSQSMMQNFRNFILERSGLLPSMCCALPTDFIPLSFKESPPTLWGYVYLLQLANYFMHLFDLCSEVEGEGALQCYCRCNLCSPHRCLATNPSLYNEMQLIGSFELQRPDGEGGLKLTGSNWASALLRKFEDKDFHPHVIKFYEDESSPCAVTPTACVINNDAILCELHEIKKARENFLLKKGRGVYLDPETGEELNMPFSAEPDAPRKSRQRRKPHRLAALSSPSAEAPPRPDTPLGPAGEESPSG